MIAANADQLGTPRLKIVAGEAPDTLQGKPRPDAVFIGGGVGIPGVFETAWEASEARRPHGRQCRDPRRRNASLSTCRKSTAAISSASKFRISPTSARYRALKPRMAVTQWRAIKP